MSGTVLAEAQQLARSGKPAEAVALVRRAAEGGDAEALYALANWALYGINGPADPWAAHGYLERAVAAGSSEAQRLLATLIGNGTGCEADPGRARAMLEPFAGGDPALARQLVLLDAMPPEADATALPADSLSSDPPIRMVRGLLTSEECEYLMSLAQPQLRPSYIVDPQTRRPVPHPFRTSEGMNFSPAQENLFVHALNRRIAVATRTAVECGEPLHILRYVPGQEYRPHLDALPGVGNQRSWTALTYLNEGYEGGETRFEEIGVTAKGAAGDALVFRNVREDGSGDPRTRHAGLPVTGGVKWLATRWIRERPFDPTAAPA